jgi:4-diphosphocytidyl-2-C-methyl-D-erythritol kinase
VTAPSAIGAPRSFLGLPAPAKLNSFLHVVGRRADGYHEIQSLFVPIDLADTIDLELRTDGRIVREGDLTGPEPADLAVRAARALQEYARAAGRDARSGVIDAEPPSLGVTVRVEKRIPVGAGLGGGSSDAATTLIGLNRLWNLGLNRAQLAELARGLGADVPFFLGSGPAFVEGIGEQCVPLAPGPAWFVVVYPQVHVSTAEIFADPKLTRDSKRTTIAGFSATLQAAAGAGSLPPPVAAEAPVERSTVPPMPFAAVAPVLFGRNDLEPVVRRRFPAVEAAVRLLDACAVAQSGAAGAGPAAAVRMSGSGSAVFCVLGSAADAQAMLARVQARMPAGWSAWALEALAELPLAHW